MAKDKIDKQANHNFDLFSVLGSSGLERYDGLIYEEFLPQLQHENGIRIYKEMQDNDNIVGATLFAIDNLIRQTNWRFEPFSEEQADIEAAEFMDEVIQDMSMSWQDTISSILSFLPFGWSYHEIVYKRRLGDNKDPSKKSRFNDGKIGIRKIAVRSQDSLDKWEFDEDGGIKGLWQIPPPAFNSIFIPIEKALLFRTTTNKNNPEGKSILRNAYRSWYFKKNIENIEAIGLERDLAGLPIAFVPPEILNPNASTQEKNILSAIKDIVQNVRNDEQAGIVFPQVFDDNGNKLYDFQLLSSGGRRQFDTNSIINRYDQRIAMTVLADFVLLGSQQVGSFALSSDKTKIFSVALGAWLDSIAAIVNRHLTPRLFALNGMDTSRLPMLVHGDVESIELSELGEYISKLAGAGAPLFPNQELENFLLQVAGLPVNEAPDEL